MFKNTMDHINFINQLMKNKIKNWKFKYKKRQIKKNMFIKFNFITKVKVEKEIKFN